MGVNLILCK